MNRKTIIWSVIVALILGAALLPRLLPSKNSKTAQSAFAKNGAKGSRSVKVSTGIATLSAIEEKIIVNGTLVAARDAELRNEIAGRVTGVYFKEGMIVKKGQMLLTLNDRDLQAQLLKAISNANLMKDKLQRQKSLFDKQLISIEEYQTSLNNSETANADVEILKAQIDKSKIFAPFTGTTGLTTVNEGEYLATGSKICNFVSTDNPDVEFSVVERYAPFMKKGMQVTFSLSGSTETYNAEVIAVEPRIDEATRSVSLKARCPVKDEKLITGMFVKVSLTINQHDGILVPSEAVVSDIDGYKIYTVKGNTAVPVLVNTGFRDENNVEIISGIKAGDTYISGGAFMLRPGSKIETQDTSDKQQSSNDKSRNSAGGDSH